MGFGANKSESKLAESLTYGQRSFLDQLGSLLGGQLGGTTYVPGATSLQQAGFEQLMQPQAQQGQYQSAIASLLGGTPASAYEVNPEARQAVYSSQAGQALQNWQQNIIPSIMESYNARGLGRSGGIERALATSGQQLTSDLASLQAQFEYQDEAARRAGLESGANRNLQSLLGGAQAYQYGQGIEQSRLAQLLGAGEQQRAIEMQQQPYSNPWLTYIPQLLGTQAYTPLTSSWGFQLK